MIKTENIKRLNLRPLAKSLIVSILLSGSFSWAQWDGAVNRPSADEPPFLQTTGATATQQAAVPPYTQLATQPQSNTQSDMRSNFSSHRVKFYPKKRSGLPTFPSPQPVLVLKHPGTHQTYFVDLGSILVDTHGFKDQIKNQSYAGVVEIGKIFSINGYVYFKSPGRQGVMPLQVLHENVLKVADLYSSEKIQTSLTLGNAFLFDTSNLKGQGLSLDLEKAQFDFVPLSVGVAFRKNKESRLYIHNSVGMSVHSPPYIQIQGIIKL